MENEVLLIDYDMLVGYSPIGKNVAEEKLFPFVLLSQQLNLTPLLGEPLVSELQFQIANENLTPENKVLLIKIAPYLSLDSTYLALRSLSYSITEKGVTKEHSENSESLNHTELAEWKLELMGLKEDAKTLLIDFLCECSESYPLWHPSKDVCKCREKDPDHSTKGLIFFPNKKKNCGCGCGD